ncbi:hypothetical protein ELUMI_v1c00930 [Williamsoniiplasma luminosum]|uniref:Uncharacterized protein n=1 Tax=Williamsoniiplasma luminosum TaxID=214888 RepID=A0A2K8NVQ0_9MOLU|nr:hypothetical protein [Williamsoniiplasma luminosum]ATZ16821.1 hypothetical protein ELUMI_v1c00930 [Williamsoniiplasma luminosum]
MDNFVNLELYFLSNHGNCVFSNSSCDHTEKKKCLPKIIVLKLIDANENEINQIPLYYKATSKINHNEPNNSWLKLNDYNELKNILHKNTFIRVGNKEEDFQRNTKTKVISSFPDKNSRRFLSLKIKRDILDLFLNEGNSLQLNHLSKIEATIINKKLLHLENLIEAAIEYDEVNFDFELE